MFKKIVVAIDGSKHSSKTVEAAAQIAAEVGGTLSIVTVLPPALTLYALEAMPQVKRLPRDVKEDIEHFRAAVASAGSRVPSSIISIPAPHSAIAALGDLILEDAEALARKRGVEKVKRSAIDGHPAEAIVAFADKTKADMIVIGTRGQSDIQGVFMGSISHKVLQLAKCPCLMIK